MSKQVDYTKVHNPGYSFRKNKEDSEQDSDLQVSNTKVESVS